MGSSERRSVEEMKRKEMVKSNGTKRILIEDIRVFRGQVLKYPLGLEYDFNKESYKDEVTGERFYLVRAHYNGRLDDGLEYQCMIKFRFYSDEDYSKMASKEALSKLTKRLNAKYYNPDNGAIKTALHRAVSLMSKYTDKSYANKEAIYNKHSL